MITELEKVSLLKEINKNLKINNILLQKLINTQNPNNQLITNNELKYIDKQLCELKLFIINLENGDLN